MAWGVSNFHLSYSVLDSLPSLHFCVYAYPPIAGAGKLMALWAAHLFCEYNFFEIQDVHLSANRILLNESHAH